MNGKVCENHCRWEGVRCNTCDFYSEFEEIKEEEDGRGKEEVRGKVKEV